MELFNPAGLYHIRVMEE